jgi:hypothetical protein
MTAAKDSPSRSCSATCLTCLTSLDYQHATPRPGTLQDLGEITYAMSLLQAGVDASVIAIWLGHESVRSTDPYLHADMAIKQRALERTAPVEVIPGRYRPPDQLLAFLNGL